MRLTNEVSDLTLTIEQAPDYARLVLKSIHREYPNALAHLLNDASQALTPRVLHPAFYGCFDWHSAVHGHWLLARLLRLFPSLPEAADIRHALDSSLSRDNIELEAAYFAQPGRKSFERTYGWAWLLKLGEELCLAQDNVAARWCDQLKPLAELIVEKFEEFLPKQNYPIRTGVHPNTAFGLSLALDYSRTVGNGRFESLLIERSLAYYSNDADYPAQWEPGGEDFLSPALVEAYLMQQVLSKTEFENWFSRFLPGMEGGSYGLLQPAVILDRTDPKLVHLDGLNLSRAWCMKGIASSLPTGDPGRSVLIESAIRHAHAALPYVAGGDYVGEHWLATFAVLLLQCINS